MNSNRKYKVTIFALIGVIVAQVFVPLEVGGKIMINKHEYEKMKQISKKYIKQENVLEDVKDMFLFDVKDEKIQEGSLKGMVDSLDDPYTIYMDKSEYANMNDEYNNLYFGLGILFCTDPNDGSAKIREVLPNSPAYEAGLQPEDVIIKINSEDILNNVDLDDLVSKLKNKDDKEVNLEIKRGNDKISFKITKKKIEITNIYSDKIGNAGYIKLCEFNKDIGKQFKDKLEILMKDGIDKLVIDLRGNPGGMLEEVVEIANMFVAEGTKIVYTKNKEGISEEIIADGNVEKINIPLAVLVDQNSASASELLASVIKDNKLGVIVGTTTYGKGIVQIVKPYSDGSALKVTVSEYFTTNGNKIDKNGVRPDIELNKDRDYKWNYTDPDYNMKEDKCLQAALQVI